MIALQSLQEKFRPADCVASDQLLFSLDETDIEVENVCSEDYAR